MTQTSHAVEHDPMRSRGMSGDMGRIERKIRDAGADVVMFVDRDGKLNVLDAESGEVLHDFSDAAHPDHPAEITINPHGEPVLVDKCTQQPIAVFEKTCDQPFRVPVAKSDRYLDARMIYFWRYKGSHCTCIWSGGTHVVR